MQYYQRLLEKSFVVFRKEISKKDKGYFYDNGICEMIRARQVKLVFQTLLQQRKRSAPRSFLDAYPGADYRVVSMDDYLDFVTSL